MARRTLSRREFIAVAGGIASGVLISSCASPTQQPAGQSADQPAWLTRDYKFAGWPSTAGQYLWAAMTMSLVSNKTGMRIQVLETSGTEENVHLINDKAADFGHMSGANVPDILKVKPGDFNHNLRYLLAHAAGVWQMAIADDANVKTIADLVGKKFNPGPAGGGSTTLTMEFMDMFGIKPDYYQATLNDAVEAYNDRQIVGFAYRGTGSEATSGMVEGHAGRPMHILGFSDEQIATIRKKYPDLKQFTIAKNLYPDQDYEVNTIADWTGGEAAHKDMPEEAVYAFLKCYWENFKTIAKQYPSVAVATEKVSTENCPFYMHKGAVKYYREKGFTLPDSMIPPEAK